MNEDLNLEPVAPIQEEPLMKVDPNVNLFAATNFRNQFRKFGIKIDDRRRHMYVIGKTGMGKSAMLENMVLHDIYAGHGVGLIDPHGDFAEKIIDYIPPNRINDVVYFNPADMDYPIGFNILETVRQEHKHLVAAGLMGVFKKIWPDVWSSRMEYILNNTILALLDYPDATLLGINRLLVDDDYREKVVKTLTDPVIRAFWETEFASYTDRYKQEAVPAIQNKIGQFLSASVIRNIIAQVKSKINIREIMDNKKIFIVNLSKGRIGEDNSRLLGGMLITKIQLSAMERVDTPEKDRKDFFLYVDEFQNFATESFANILSEARKYRLDLTMAHQYMEQLEEEVRAAVIGNVGSLITFRVGSTDAEILAKEFTPTFTEEDLVNLPKYNIYLKLMIDGVASRPFSAVTLPPIAIRMESSDKVIRVTRERYATPRENIEDKIKRWSGIESEEQKSGGTNENILMTDNGPRLIIKKDSGAKPKKPPFHGGFQGGKEISKIRKAPRPISEILADYPENSSDTGNKVSLFKLPPRENVRPGDKKPHREELKPVSPAPTPASASVSVELQRGKPAVEAKPAVQEVKKEQPEAKEVKKYVPPATPRTNVIKPGQMVKFDD